MRTTAPVVTRSAEIRERELDRAYTDLANWLDAAPASVWPLIAEGRHDMRQEAGDRLERHRGASLRQVTARGAK